MTIHVVKQGETLKSISEMYHVEAQRLIIENGITNPDHLVVGQTIVIIHPKITYTATKGDTIISIAEKYKITVMELLRNNPNLSGREILYPGETIVISYDTNRISKIAISGYAYPFINKDILQKTLPFLTYLTIFNYQFDMEGNISNIDDTEVIKIAKDYGVAPLMLLSSLSEMGTGSSEIAYYIMSNPEIQNRLIENTMNLLKEKGYYGLNIYLKFLRPENRTLVEDYIRQFSKRLKSEGYRVVVSITPRNYIEGTDLYYENIDYSTIASYVDNIMFLSYDWSYSYGPPASTTPLNIIRKYLTTITNVIPANKILIGFPVIGYDWELPYIPGDTVARAVTNDLAIELAVLANAKIQYNEVSEAPYFYYTNELNELHIVWFKDARSIDAITNLVPSFGLNGLSIWNIMRFFAQLWFIINNKFDIEKVSDVNLTTPS